VSSVKTKFAAKAAKTLRTNSTDAERKLWSRLRDRRLLNFKFVRQQPIGPFIADFACREADLIIELDGSQHQDAAEARYDAERSEVLSRHGYEVMRFWNTDVLLHIDSVLILIAERLQKADSPGLRFAKSGLSPQGEVVPTENQEVSP
jgi:very-short-patch-repair endonuclease